jgi:hypothetical protein
MVENDDEAWLDWDGHDVCFDLDLRRDAVWAAMMASWWAEAAAPLMCGPARFNRGVGCMGEVGPLGRCRRLPPEEVDAT